MRSPAAVDSAFIFKFSQFFILLFVNFLRLSIAADRPTLYAPGDNVLELDVNTFDKAAYHRPRAFFVEFYSSWCGHCIEYKPHFVRFATMVKDWRDVVVVAVLNCADELNAPICREHSIDAFPTLKYFHVNAKGKEDAIKFEDDKKDLALVASKLTEWAKADFDKGLAPRNWPQLEFVKSDNSLSDIWSTASKNAQILAVIVDVPPATNAYSTMLNYASDPRIQVVLCTPDHQIPVKVGGSSLKSPALLVFSRSSSEHPIFTSANSPIETWLEMQKKLDELLSSYPNKPVTPPLDSLKYTEEDKADHQSDKQIHPSIKVDWRQYEIQYLDLVSALHYMLTVEIPRNPVLGNTELTTLKRFIHLLRQYGPGSTPIKRLFYRLDEWLSAQHQPAITTETYLSKLEEIQSDLGHPIPANTSYMACRGSKPYLRGYTCGLWTLLHILTVQAYTERHSSPSFDPVKEVLGPIHQFIVQFLSCEVCSKNFDKMANEDGILNVHRPEEVVLWLWRGHNKVNKRLKGEASEDPNFPKQQFPPKSICSECYSAADAFDEQKVLQFLLRYYSNVRTDNYKPSPSYTVKEFANGKVEKTYKGRLNPKFEPMAGKVDKLEEIEARIRTQQEGGFKRKWKSIEDDFGGPSPNQSNLHFILLGLIGVVLMSVYYKYRQNRSKFWKTFYYLNDYKLIPWRRNSSAQTANLHKYSV